MIGPASGLVACLVLAVIGVALRSGSPQQPAAPVAGPAAGAGLPAATDSNLERAYGRLPLRFVENGGQTDRRVSHLVRGAGFGFFFTKEKAVLTFVKGRREQVLNLRFIGANPDPQILGAREAPGKVTYLRAAGSRSGLRTFGELRYRELWPGIDMIFRGQDGGLEYEFAVAPGARVSDIRFAYEGARDLELARSGRLLIRTPLGTLTDARPRSYQRVGARRVTVDTRFTLNGTSVGFDVARHDTGRALLVDPRLAYSTFLGGAVRDRSNYADDAGTAIAADAGGNVYVTGQTATSDFPTTPGAFDTSSNGRGAFVTKLDPTGSEVLYSTYLGGTEESTGLAIAVDSQGCAYVAGQAGVGFPTTDGAFDPTTEPSLYEDGFVAKLSASGSELLYATYLAGSATDRPAGIQVDAAGHAYVSGETISSNFPTTPGALQTQKGGPTGYDIFVTKLAPSGGSLVYSTYLGKTFSETSAGLALDGSGNTYVTGETRSVFVPDDSDFPVTAGAYQTDPSGVIFVAKLNSSGSGLAYSARLGASRSEETTGIGVDAAGSAYVTGRTTASSFPTTPGAFKTSKSGQSEIAFVSKLNPAGTGLAYSTFLGGTGGEGAAGIAVEPAGAAWVTGYTTSDDFPIPNGAPRPSGGYDYQGFAARLSPDGSQLLYGSYLGGSTGAQLAAVAVDPAGNAYFTGWTYSLDMATEGAFDSSHNGYIDAFVTKVAVAPPPSVLSLLPANAAAPIDTEHCLTATAHEAASVPSANVRVRFAVTGTNSLSRTRATGANGQARLCYSTTRTGNDAIAAYADTNRNGSRDPGEPTAAAGVTWTPATSPPGTIHVDANNFEDDADGCGGGAGAAADPCNTVQAGVDAARPGDTVSVAPSAAPYVEEVTVDKAGLALVGPQDGVPAYDRPLNPGADEAILTGPPHANAAVTVAAPEVLVSGFTLRDTYVESRPTTPAIDITGADAAIFDSLFRDNGSGIRISADGASISGNLLHRNSPYLSTAPGILGNAEASNADISGNAFDNNGNTAVRMAGAAGLLLEGNVVLSPGVPSFGSRIELAGVTDAVVHGNAVIGADQYALAAAGVDGLTVSGNLFAESLLGGVEFAPLEEVPNRNVVLSGNELVANGDQLHYAGAIRLAPRAFSDTLRVVANRFVDNYAGDYPVGIMVESPAGPAPVDARNNWWGCNEGPTHGVNVDQTCDAVYGGVDTDPWLTFSLRASPAELDPGGTATLTAGLLANSAGAAPPEAASIPEGLVQLEEVAGVGTLSAPEIVTSAGAGTATLSSATPGTAEVHAFFDYAEVAASVVFRGPPAQPAPVTARDVTAPVVSGASVKPSTFAVNPFGAAERLLRKRAGMGTVFGFKVSEGSTVTFSIERALRGRRVGRKCRPATKRNRGRRRCMRYRAAGKFAVQAKAGPNSKSFSGKIGSKQLRPGSYRALITASDGAGNRSKPRVLTFRVVPR